jgi:hypothetical protein
MITNFLQICLLMVDHNKTDKREDNKCRKDLLIVVLIL